jgi:hypothetical protein
MRKLTTGVIATFILCLFSIAILADDKDKMLKEHVEISSDVMIGNTHVKKGYYLVKYNEETGMMKIVKATNPKKVVATARATVKMNDKEFEHDEILTRNTSGHEVLTGLRLGGQKEELTLTDSVASSQ